MNREYHYGGNLHIINEVINELVLARTTQEITDYDYAIKIVFLKMFPCVSEDADAIEKLFNEYANDFNVKEWYNSNPIFSIPITLKKQ